MKLSFTSFFLYMFISRGDKNTWNEGIIHFQDFYTIFWILLFVFTQFHEFFPTKSWHKKFVVELHEFLHYFQDLSSLCLLILVCRYTFSSSTIVVRKSANKKKKNRVLSSILNIFIEISQRKNYNLMGYKFVWFHCVF